MVQSLVDYVKKEVTEGYSVEQIRSALVKYGYSQLQIDEAIKQYYGQAGKKGKIIRTQKIRTPIKINKKIIFVVIGIILIVLAFFVVLNFSGKIIKEKDEKISISFESVSTEVNPGQEISFVKNIDSINKVSVSVSYQLLDKKENVVLTSYEKFDADGKISSQTNINIPENTELGDYKLKIISRYNGNEDISYLPVKIYRISDYATCYDNILNQDEEKTDCGGPCSSCKECPSNCDDNDDCTTDYCSEQSSYECAHEIIESCRISSAQQTPEQNEQNEIEGETPKESNPVSGTATTLRSVRNELYPLIKSNPVEAARVCSSITESVEKDICFKTVAELSNSSNYCNYITLQLTKDSCYMKFVINQNEFQHCENIQDSYLKDSCESIKKMKEMEAQYYAQQQ